MKTRTCTALVAMAIIAVTALLNFPAARAQCISTTVTNLTNCDIHLCLYDMAGNKVCLDLTSVGTPGSTGVLSLFRPIGVISAAKKNYLFTGSPFCSPCVTIPGSFVVTGCCATVCFDTVACAITVSPCPGPCLP